MLMQLAVTLKERKLLYEAPALLSACKDALNSLNQLTNKSLTGKYKNTYEVCSMLEKIIKQAE